MIPVRETHRFNESRLETYLEYNLPLYEGPTQIRQFSGGQSCPTYQIYTPHRTYVLRRKPPGKLLPSAHAVEREYRVLSALEASKVPVPKVLLLCEDSTEIGTPFYIMEYIDGRIFWDLSLPDMSPIERCAIFDEMNKIISQVHTIDLSALHLNDFGKPRGYLSRQIHRWIHQYRSSETENIAAMEDLISWLPSNLPPEGPSSLVHGDFRIDNLIFDLTETRIVAVLDWEVSTVGNPISDFAYHCMLWRLPPDIFKGLSGLNLRNLGIPSEHEYVETYCTRTNRSDLGHLDFHIAFNMFRLAAILQGIKGRIRDGTAASADAAAHAALARPVAEAGWREVQAIRS